MTKLIVILGFALAFAAGVVIGARSRTADLLSPATASPTTEPSNRKSDHGSFWATELGLTSPQREKLDKIWSEVARRGRNEHDEKRREYRRDRDVAIADLVPPARMGEYDHIMDAYTERLTALDRESRENYDAAVEQTKQILTPEQRTRYEELLKRHSWGPGVRDPRRTTRRSETRATSGPSVGAESTSSSSSSSSSLSNSEQTIAH